jgi:hypothetical protein
MAETPKQSVVDKAAKSPRNSKPVPNSYEERLRQYEEDKRNGWYKKTVLDFRGETQKLKAK